MNGYFFIFIHQQLLLQRLPDGQYTIPFGQQPPAFVSADSPHLHVTPMEDGTPVTAISIEEAPHLPSHYELSDLRSAYYKLSMEHYLKAGKCSELLYWDANSRFCGVCGAPMTYHTDISKRCTRCGKEIWPQLSTAIIVRIERGDELLLVHAKNFKKDFYGLVAGFVETGETLEEAVHREVMEETGITIDNLRYFGSQPWPYPCGLMVGFTASYLRGELRFQADEIARGGWFNRQHLPAIPEKLSIARRLIDDWLSRPVA